MEWERVGQVEFLQQCKSQLHMPAELRQCVYNLLNQVLQGRVKPSHASTGLAELVQLQPNTVNTLADVLLLLDFETQVNENKAIRTHFLDLLVCCCHKVIPESMLKERIDFDTCGDANIVHNKKTAQTKFIKLKTRLFYKQQKFNLYREESEGYAKLITELKDEANANPTHALEMLRSLIGCFNLDPNRVLDVILECFETSLHQHAFYVQLITAFLHNSATLTQMLAFKFNFYQHDASLFTPASLYEVTAILIKNHLVSLDAIWPFLLPTDHDIYHYYDQLLAEEKKNSTRLVKPPVELKLDEQLDELLKHQLKSDNQKITLCFYLLKVADWANASNAFRLLPPNYALSHPNLSQQLCRYVHYVIEPFYRTNCGLNTLLQKRIIPPTYPFSSTIEIANDWTQFKRIALPMLDELGAFVYCDQLLVIKLIRILRALLPKQGVEIRYDALNMLGDIILPAITMIESNCALAEELWHVLRHFPYTIRYKLYSNWRQPLPIPASYHHRGNIERKIKYIMKRLSKENVKMFGRQIGKLTHSNPSFMFDYILSQIQCYDNLIGPVIDSFKYLNSVSYDVLIYCVIETLGNPIKKKTNLDGASISPWMLSLSNFCGAVVKKYPVELPGLLQFIANQLKTKQSLDLIILKEIIQKMTGIEAADEMTEDQIAALSGGELLKNEGGYFHQVRNTRKSSARLKEALLESDLAMPLCILMAQQRNCILFYDQEHSYLKLVSKLYDQCQQTLVQYGSFLAGNLSIDDYIGHLPSIQKLIQKFHLTSDVVFYLTRPMIVHNVNQTMQQLAKNANVTHTDQEAYTRTYFDAWDVVTETIINSMANDVNHKLWSNLSAKFFMSFWALTNYDLQVPTASYEKEADRLKGQMQAIEDKDMPATKKKKEIERCRALLDRLLDEQQRQDEHVRRVRLRLDREKVSWFGTKQHRVEMTIQFLQHCLIPRCVFTANDALYCAEFVHLLHTIQTPNFSTLICYDRIFCDISYSLSMCTEDGANNYGRFLCGLLKTIMSWHKDRAVFERDCAKYPGFVTKFGDNDPVYVDYENYRHVCHKWHYRLTKAFIFCLDSGDYMQIRNSLIVLTKVLPHLPVMTSFANVIERHVEQLRVKEKEKRPDLYALATGYAGQLKMRKSFFIPESEFHIKKPDAPTYVVSATEPQIGTNAGTNVPTNSSGGTFAGSEPSAQSTNKEIVHETLSVTPIVNNGVCTAVTQTCQSSLSSSSSSTASRELGSNGNLTVILTKDVVVRKEKVDSGAIIQQQQSSSTKSSPSAITNRKDSDRAHGNNISMNHHSNPVASNMEAVYTNTSSNYNSGSNSKSVSRNKSEDEVKTDRSDQLSKSAKRAALDERFALRTFERINNSNKSDGRNSSANSPKQQGRNNDDVDARSDRDHRDRRRKDTRATEEPTINNKDRDQERYDRQERQDRLDRGERIDRVDRSDRVDRADRQDRSDRQERVDRRKVEQLRTDSPHDRVHGSKTQRSNRKRDLNDEMPPETKRRRDDDFKSKERDRKGVNGKRRDSSKRRSFDEDKY